MSRFALRDYRDLITGSAVILGAVAMFVASANLKDFAAIGVGASFMPRLTALLLFIVGLVIAASTWRTGGRNREPLKAEAAEPGVFGGLPAGPGASPEGPVDGVADNGPANADGSR
mgnify:CR=1 FL=1